MKFHIVGQKENIRKIAFLYDLEIDEIKKENRHIRDWSNLVPGIKLKIPVISESVNQTINEFEPFIEEYYPKLDLNNTLEEDNSFEDLKNDKISEEISTDNNQEIIEINNDNREPVEEIIKEPIGEIKEQVDVKNKKINDLTYEEKNQSYSEKMNPGYIPRYVYPPCYSPYSYMFPYRQIVYIVRRK